MITGVRYFRFLFQTFYSITGANDLIHVIEVLLHRAHFFIRGFRKPESCLPGPLFKYSKERLMSLGSYVSWKLAGLFSEKVGKVIRQLEFMKHLWINQFCCCCSCWTKDYGFVILCCFWLRAFITLLTGSICSLYCLEKETYVWSIAVWLMSSLFSTASVQFCWFCLVVFSRD